MKRITMLGLLAFFALSFVSLAQNNAPAPVDGPKVSIEGGDSYDWGNVKPEPSPIKMDLKITNTGNKLLKLKSVKPGCGCTVAQLTKDSLEPRETTVVPVSLNISTYDGPVSKGITIESNDPTRPIIYYTLKANVVRPVSYRPSYMAFNNLFVGKEDKGTMILHNNLEKDITVTGVNINSPDLKLNLKAGDVLPSKKDFNLEGIVKIDKPGYFNVKFEITTNSLEIPKMEYYAYGSVLDVPSHPVETPGNTDTKISVSSPDNKAQTIELAPAKDTDAKAKAAKKKK